MKRDNHLKVSILIALLAVLISALTGVYSYHVSSSSRKLQKNYHQKMDSLQQEVARLDEKIILLSEALSAAPEPTRQPAVYLNSKKKPTSVLQPSGAKLQTLRQVEQILDSTGLAQLAENENVDPSILQQMYDEYAQRNQIASYRQQLLEKDRDRLDADSKNYAEELMSLYEMARLQRGSDIDRETRERAFDEMLAKYPDAYATAKVIGQRALRSAFRGNTAAVEEYYNLLRQNDKFSAVATDRGTEVLPNVEHYLAQQYLREGRIEDARLLRDSLELNYSDSYIITRETGAGWRWLPVSQVVTKLDRQLK